MLQIFLQYVAVVANILQCVEVCCSVLRFPHSYLHYMISLHINIQSPKMQVVKPEHFYNLI